MPAPTPIPAALAADLRALNDALDDPASDLADSVQRLSVTAGLAVDSYLGLSVRYTEQARSFSFVHLPQPAPPARSSLRISVAGQVLAELVLVLYAERPGAFVDLAADLSWLTARPSRFEVDRDLPDQPVTATGWSLTQQSSIDQAVGVLIGLGNTVEQAHAELQRTTRQTGITELAAALAILAELT